GPSAGRGQSRQAATRRPRAARARARRPPARRPRARSGRRARGSTPARLSRRPRLHSVNRLRREGERDGPHRVRTPPQGEVAYPVKGIDFVALRGTTVAAENGDKVNGSEGVPRQRPEPLPPGYFEGESMTRRKALTVGSQAIGGLAAVAIILPA